MKLREIVLAAVLGASLAGCGPQISMSDKSRELLEHIAAERSAGSNSNYQNVNAARTAVYDAADTNGDGNISYTEAKEKAKEWVRE